MRQDTGTPDTLGLIVRVSSLLSELVREFLATCRTDMLTIRSAMVTADYATVEDLGHRMRRAGGGLGFDFVTDVGGEIENAAKRHDEPIIRGQIKIMQNFLDHVEVVVANPR